MMQIRRSSERGHFDHGWLDTYHTFSFSDYFDRAHMGFRDLRVINEDRVAPSEGFETHSHRDMEIITWVLSGSLKHQDSMGNGSVIRPGEAQYMSAGSGVTHSEFNASASEPVHLLQIWILPNEKGAVPRYDQKSLMTDKTPSGRLVCLASPDGAEGSIAIRQDVRLYAGRLEAEQTLTHRLEGGRHGWVQLTQGSLSVNGEKLEPGDGVALSELSQVQLVGMSPAESRFLFFDLN